MKEDTRSFLLTFGGIGAVALIGAAAYALAVEVGKPEAGRWLALSVIVSGFAAFRWHDNRWGDMPGPLRIVGVVLLALLYARTAYLFVV